MSTLQPWGSTYQPETTDHPWFPTKSTSAILSYWVKGQDDEILLPGVLGAYFNVSGLIFDHGITICQQTADKATKAIFRLEAHQHNFWSSGRPLTEDDQESHEGEIWVKFGVIGSPRCRIESTAKSHGERAVAIERAKDLPLSRVYATFVKCKLWLPIKFMDPRHDDEEHVARMMKALLTGTIASHSHSLRPALPPAAPAFTTTSALPPPRQRPSSQSQLPSSLAFIEDFSGGSITGAQSSQSHRRELSTFGSPIPRFEAPPTASVEQPILPTKPTDPRLEGRIQLPPRPVDAKPEGRDPKLQTVSDTPAQGLHMYDTRSHERQTMANLAPIEEHKRRSDECRRIAEEWKRKAEMFMGWAEECIQTSEVYTRMVEEYDRIREGEL